MEQRLDIEERAAATILERGVRIQFCAPLFLRLLGKKQISLLMKPAPMGRLMAISQVFTSMGVEVETIDDMTSLQLNDFVVKHGDSIIRILSIMLIGVSRFERLMCWWLKREVTSRKLSDIVKLMVAVNGVESFMSSIVLMGQMRITQPRMTQTMTSPMENGSQEA